MPSWSLMADLTANSLPNLGGSGIQAYRVSNAVNTYIPGIVCGYVAVDSQILPDFQTVQPLAAGTTTPLVAGVVKPSWGGFDNAGTRNTSYASVASQLNLRGTLYVPLIVKGIAYVWIDQSGTGAVTLTNGLPIVSSRTTAGYGQGVALATATNISANIGNANLPAAGIGSSLTAAALAQASVTFTITGAPAAGDVISATLQIPYNDLQPGTAQTVTISTAPLTAAQAVSVTTAATAFAAALNASPYFAVQSVHGVGSPTPYFVATSSAGVVTVTVNALANPFLVTGGATNIAGSALEQWRFLIGLSGMVGNSLTSVAGYTQAGGSTGVNTAGGATFSGGTGFKGIVPALIYGAY
jgi:hypothetical protein